MIDLFVPGFALVVVYGGMLLRWFIVQIAKAKAEYMEITEDAK